MADTNITIPELGSLTAGQVSDLLLVTRGTTGYKMLVSDIAKTIIETYQGSSLAGSTQSVKSALDALNSKMAVTYQYTLNAISNIKKNWNTYSAGFFTEEITSATETSPVGGPIYRALIFKYNNNFGCVLLMTYSYQQDRLVFIQCQNNEWGTPYQLR